MQTTPPAVAPSAAANQPQPGKPTHFHEMLRWAAEDLSDPTICASATLVTQALTAAITRLTPYVDEVVKLAWRQLQADQKLSSGHDLVRGQSPQALGIGGPGAGRAGGNTPIVVEVYALGRGVTIERQGGDLCAGEGSFELEAFDKRFIFNMASAIQAQGLVAPIHGNVASVALPLQAMNQKDVAELKRINSHTNCSLKTVIVALPPATGKTTLAKQMMTKFGCTSIVEEWCNRKPLTPGALHLTNQPLFARE